MRDLDEKQYERVARRLDGEEISLTAEEQALVEELGLLEAELGTGLDMALPAGVASRLGGRLDSALHPGRGVRLWFRPAGMLAAAAAVLLAVGAGLWSLLPGEPRRVDVPSRQAQSNRQPSRPGEWDTDLARALLKSHDDAELNVFAVEVGRLEAETVITSVSVDAPEVEMNALERDLGEMLHEDSRPFLPEI